MKNNSLKTAFLIIQNLQGNIIMKIIKLIAVIAALGLLSGCATLKSENSQSGQKASQSEAISHEIAKLNRMQARAKAICFDTSCETLESVAPELSLSCKQRRKNFCCDATNKFISEIVSSKQKKYLSTAFSYLLKACDLGSGAACYDMFVTTQYLPDQSLSAEDKKALLFRALRLLENECKDERNVASCRLAGQMLTDGKNIEQDIPQAIVYFKLFDQYVFASHKNEAADKSCNTSLEPLCAKVIQNAKWFVKRYYKYFSAASYWENMKFNAKTTKKPLDLSLLRGQWAMIPLNNGIANVAEFRTDGTVALQEITCKWDKNENVKGNVEISQVKLVGNNTLELFNQAGKLSTRLVVTYVGKNQMRLTQKDALNEALDSEFDYYRTQDWKPLCDDFSPSASPDSLSN
jgi:hypothetical protein